MYCLTQVKPGKISFHPAYFVFIKLTDCDAHYRFFSVCAGVLRTNIRIKCIFLRWELNVNYFIKEGIPLRRSINSFHILVPSEVVWFLIQRIWNKKSLNPCWIPKDLIKNWFLFLFVYEKKQPIYSCHKHTL